MRAVSLWGYVPSCLAVAIVCGFGWRLRLGVTLILAIVFADAMAVAAKSAFASPRPHAVDTRVRTFSALESGLPMATATSVPADDFGFPSGHVAATAAWALGLAWSRRKSWQLGVAATWVALMALSRMAWDAISRGRRRRPVVGVAGSPLARLELSPAVAGISTCGRHEDGPGVSLVAVALAALSGAGLGLMMPAVSVASRGALLLMHTRALDDSVRRRRGCLAWRWRSSFLVSRSGRAHGRSRRRWVSGS
jgi:hypothetical protein